MMFGFIKKMFIGLLSTCTTVRLAESLAPNSEVYIKCVSLNNQPCQGRATLVNINSDRTLFIHLLSLLISVVEVLVLLMIVMFHYVFQIR